MGRLRFGQSMWVVVTISLFSLLPACGGKGKPSPGSPYPVKINLNPSTSSAQVGTIFQFTASAQNGTNNPINATFAYLSSDPSILDIAPNGFACAGVWNAPQYSVCTPNKYGMVTVTASALGSTSQPSLIFVHPPIDSIQISILPPVNSLPPACPSQQELPAACNLPFNTNNCSNGACKCLSQNQVETLQATAYSQGVDVTGLVGPFTWTSSAASVVTTTPMTVTIDNVPVATNQANVSPGAPGQTQLIASASGIYSQPYIFEACPVQCIALELSENGAQLNGTSFAVNKGTSETITASAVDIQGCLVPKPALTWSSSAPASVAVGSGCSNSTTCTVTTPQPGAAAITASCTPPTCNVGFPLNLNPTMYSGVYVPEPLYPVTAISGLVTGATSATTVLSTSQDCYSDILCNVAIYSVSTSTNLPGGPTELPSAPNSLLFDPAGDKAYMGSEFGALAINPTNLGTASSAFSSFGAVGTPLGVVTGKVIGVSRNGNQAVFSDTVPTPNQVYVVTSTPASTVPLNINSATTATFSPDGLKAFILGNGGNTLYVYSTLQYLQPPISLPAPATSVVFNSSGSFALLAGGSAAGNLAVYNTCDNSSVSIPAGSVPATPLFLKMVPAGEIPQGSLTGINQLGSVTIPNLEPAGLDFFFGLDNSGIDIIATNYAQPTAGLCPQLVSAAHTPAPLNTPFPPAYINLGYGTFHPIDFFVSPDATRAYIVTTDRGVLMYDFSSRSVTGIPLINNASPVAADITADGTLIYVAGTDGLLHQLNTSLLADEFQAVFLTLPSSTNDFCYTGNDCGLNIVAVKP